MYAVLVRVCITAVTALLVATPASATEIVDNDRHECPTARHATIQSGVDAASPGETVLVCAGEYRETVYVETPGKRGVRLTARENVTLKPPAGYSGPMMNILGAPNVVIRGFRFAGPYTGSGGIGCPPPQNFTGAIFVQVARDVTIAKNVIEDIGDGFGGACSGLVASGILIGPAGGSRVVVEDNLIQGYQDYGVQVAGGFPNTTSYAVIRRNRITGGATQGGPQWGVVVTRRGSANVNNNLIVANLGATTGTGDAGGVLLDRGAETFPRPDPRIDVRANRILRNDRGILLTDQSSALIRDNVVFANQSEGVAADSNADGNTFERNDARGNGELDCRDASVGPEGAPFLGVANIWRTSNRGRDDFPSQICRP